MNISSEWHHADRRGDPCFREEMALHDYDDEDDDDDDDNDNDGVDQSIHSSNCPFHQCIRYISFKKEEM